jgi:hypothetical protein
MSENRVSAMIGVLNIQRSVMLFDLARLGVGGGCEARD